MDHHTIIQEALRQLDATETYIVLGLATGLTEDEIARELDQRTEQSWTRNAVHGKIVRFRARLQRHARARR